MAIPARGLRCLRTLSGRVDRVAVPYRAYMQVTCLEMEKARRGSERRSATQRIREIDKRLAEIEAEQVELLKELGEQHTGKLHLGHSAESKPAASRADGFKIKY